MLPLHYPDSCIFLELVSEDKESKKELAQTYLYNIDRKYKVIVSSLTYGEISMALMKTIKEDKNREMAFHKLNDILKWLDLCSPQFEDFELALELRRIHYKIEPADALHLATAMNNNVQNFITLGERGLADNEIVKKFCKERGIKIEAIG